MTSGQPTQSVAEPDDTPGDGRFLVRAAIGGFGLMFVAAGILWLRFGPVIFYDTLNFALACF